jgi:hypothetical protein
MTEFKFYNSPMTNEEIVEEIECIVSKWKPHINKRFYDDHEITFDEYKSLQDNCNERLNELIEKQKRVPFMKELATIAGDTWTLEISITTITLYLNDKVMYTGMDVETDEIKLLRPEMIDIMAKYYRTKYSKGFNREHIRKMIMRSATLSYEEGLTG